MCKILKFFLAINTRKPVFYAKKAEKVVYDDIVIYNFTDFQNLR